MPPPEVLGELAAWRADAAIALVILAAVAFALGGAWLARSGGQERQQAVEFPLSPVETPVPVPRPWWAVAGASAEGSVQERAALVEGLALRGGESARAALTQAWEVEGDPSVREGVLSALQWCDGEPPLRIFGAALTSGSEAERILAIEGLERRGRHETIATALADESNAVALAAALALHRAGREDLLAGVRERRGARFAETLELLGG
ncbi:MAG TPA: hypothetical protein VNJ51_08245 [Candidatus Dormibacteraeota bacterium]|nr:hypothetical protein [Candidatus Dormibacteraeota bacterium]